MPVFLYIYFLYTFHFLFFKLIYTCINQLITFLTHNSLLYNHTLTLCTQVALVALLWVICNKKNKIKKMMLLVAREILY